MAVRLRGPKPRARAKAKAKACVRWIKSKRDSMVPREGGHPSHVTLILADDEARKDAPPHYNVPRANIHALLTPS